MSLTLSIFYLKTNLQSLHRQRQDSWRHTLVFNMEQVWPHHFSGCWLQSDWYKTLDHILWLQIHFLNQIQTLWLQFYIFMFITITITTFTKDKMFKFRYALNINIPLPGPVLDSLKTAGILHYWRTEVVVGWLELLYQEHQELKRSFATQCTTRELMWIT